MGKGITVTLTGDAASDTAVALCERLKELGQKAEHLDEAQASDLGGAQDADNACGTRAQAGIIVVATYAGAAPAGDCIDAAINPNDTPEFAAEKVLDMLAEAGCISLDDGEYTPEEEEQIRQRLSDLGYIE